MKGAAEFFGEEFVRRHFARAMERANEIQVYTLTPYLRQFHSESPLELAFVVWWTLVGDAYGWTDDFTLADQQEVEIQGERFRLDFIVLPIGGWATGTPLPGKLCIELDGHDFHERTKEQVELRNRRDRLLTADGWRVLHFAGSEFHRDPEACLTVVYHAANDVWRPILAR